MRADEFVTEDAVEDLEKDLKNPHSYDAIDHMMQTIAREQDITPKQLHDRFVEKHGITPDEWIKEKQVNENFADGKVKGKSRPGRVKRAGASCNGSVTDLRQRAKNASGEKAKMYHWCANMKSGRQK
jgi:methylphosphotriester-DNA--protein-cysteine methyltransferase